MAGLCVFFGYHTSVAAVLHAAAIPIPRLRRVRDFHRGVFFAEGKEVLRMEDINVNGRLDEADPMACEIEPGATDPDQERSAA